jgi:succinyl-CoA synthetase beta subunit
MERTRLIDSLIDRLEELKDILDINAYNAQVEAFLIQSIINNADETFLDALIDDMERFIYSEDRKRDDERNGILSSLHE